MRVPPSSFSVSYEWLSRIRAKNIVCTSQGMLCVKVKMVDITDKSLYAELSYQA